MKLNITNIKTFHNAAKFNQPHMLQSSYIHAALKSKSKKNRVITEKESGYVRQYLVKDDGSKTLISEMREGTMQQTRTHNESNDRSNADGLMKFLNSSSIVHPSNIKTIK
ncbi:hypothetical protein ACQKMD_15000 [Viridibacillus sp. NPDC096237]|uniref:hypothetical protein n=1 Tax=Viridibacillus sp. NPDC096237 TaxID=3390721 RepID=UPI003CFEED47